MQPTARTDHALPGTVDAGVVAAQRIEELEQALARAQSLYDQAPCGCLSIDAELRMVNINQTLMDWLGVSALDFSGPAELLRFVDPAWPPALRIHMAELSARGTCEPLELILQRLDGAPLHVLFSSSAVRDANGQFVHSNTMVQDIGARRAANKQLAAQDVLLQSITDRIPARLAYYDKDLLCRFSNSAHANRYGKLAGELVGSHLSDVVRTEDLPQILPRVAKALSGELQTFDADRENADGSRSSYQIHYIPDVQNGSVEGIFIELHDITERKRTEEFVLEANRDLEERVREHSAELFQSEQRYRLMVDAIQDYCIYFVDAQGMVTEWSESAQRLHGHTHQQMVGKPYQDLLATGPSTDGEDEVGAAQAMRLAQSHGQWETRGWCLRDDGSRFWGHTVLTALRNETGELQSLSAITRDMTAAKSLEDVMNDLNRELENRVAERTQQLLAANKDLDVFSHRVSHDLRAPLRHISSFVSLLLEHMGDTSDKLALQHLNSIAMSSKRMSQMIEGLLEYARLGRFTINAQPVPLAPLLDGVMAHLRQGNPERDIEWVIEEDLPVVRGDAMLLAQVWDNLLSNAVKYSRPREKARIEIGWKVNPVGGRTFYVRDNGVGFDLAKAHNLFVMFQRQHHSMDFEGIGTGLALTQRIIERHHGRIWAETELGAGCTFFFTLPFEGLELDLDDPTSTIPELTDRADADDPLAGRAEGSPPGHAQHPSHTSSSY
jgi:PAS domain S-box-containing protein